jgi:hypothetical protein
VTNQEACLILDEKNPADAVALKDIRGWLREMRELEYDEIDFDVAKAVYETCNKGSSTP